MKRILFVCLGNICRSPGAEGIMKELVRKEGFEDQFFIDSAGTYGGHNGALPDERMRIHAQRRGYNLESRARHFYAEADFANFDMIIGMDDQNIADLRRLAQNDQELGKIYKMTDFCQRIKGHTIVPDPYYSGSHGFELVLDILEDAVRGLLDRIKCENELGKE